MGSTKITKTILHTDPDPDNFKNSIKYSRGSMLIWVIRTTEPRVDRIQYENKALGCS